MGGAGLQVDFAPESRRLAAVAMKRAEKAEKILQVLDSLYPAPAIPLRHADPYTLLVAVLLSAQTTLSLIHISEPTRPY